jgi:hypothetical protein
MVISSVQNCTKLVISGYMNVIKNLPGWQKLESSLNRWLLIWLTDFKTNTETKKVF